MVDPTKTRIVASDYYHMPEYAYNDLIQLIDGEVIIGMLPLPKHQFITGEILFLLMTVAKKTGGRAVISPIEVYLDEHNVYEPDVLYLAPDSPCTIGEKRLKGAPDLVVEVLSSETAKYDKQHKFYAYELHMVEEYWIVDPVHEVIDVWFLDEYDEFTLQGTYSKHDMFKSVTLDETVAVAAIFDV